MNQSFLDSNNQISILIPFNNPETRGFYSIIDTGDDIISSFKKLIKHPILAILDFLTSGLLWSFLYLITSLFINALFQAITDDYYIRWLSNHQEIPKSYTLPDIGTDLLPFIDIPYLPSYVLVGVLTVTFLRFFFTPYRTIILKRFCFLQGTIFILRSLSIFGTYLPSPVPCTTYNKQPLFIYAMKIFSGTRSCHDLMFCPHTAALFFCAMFWYHYIEKAPLINFKWCYKVSPSVNEYGYPLRFTIEKGIICIITAIASLLFVMCKRHYTFDIYIAAIISVLLFKLYHHYILHINTRMNWFNAFLRWFEDGSPDIPELGMKQVDHDN
ncbi:hypothetical protein ENUP19_0139G0027 [Entamoeba nuttalli]